MKPLTIGAYELLPYNPDLTGFYLAGGEGLEPPLAESESAVLPLDDPPEGIAVVL